MHKFFITIGALCAALAVGLGAFGAHGLKNTLSDTMLSVYQTGVEYHMYHALGLILIGLISWQLGENKLATISGWLMLTGIVLFSGSLYVLSISGIRWLGAITPLGGTAFIIAWLLLAVAVIRA